MDFPFSLLLHNNLFACNFINLKCVILSLTRLVYTLYKTIILCLLWLFRSQSTKHMMEPERPSVIARHLEQVPLIVRYLSNCLLAAE